METSSKIEVRGGTTLGDTLNDFAKRGAMRIPPFQFEYICAISCNVLSRTEA